MRHTLALTSAALCTILAAPAAHASDLFSADTGGPAAGPALATPAAIFWNPGSLGLLRDTQAHADLSLTGDFARYTRDAETSYDPATMLSGTISPMLVGTRQLSDTGLTVGVGMHTPQFERSHWQDESSEQRWHGTYTGFQALSVSPAAAFSFSDKLHVGAAANILIARAYNYRALDHGAVFARQNDRDDVPAEDPGNEGRTAAEFKGNGSSFTFGLTWLPRASTSIAVAFVTGAEFSMDGEVSVYAPKNDYFQGNYGDQEGVDATLEMSLPRTFRIGFAHALSPATTVHGNVDYTMWSMLEEITIKSSAEQIGGVDGLTGLKDLGWRDTVQARLGVSSRRSETLTIHGLASYTSSAIPDEHLTPALINGHTAQVGAGATLALADNLNLGLAYSHRFMLPRSIDSSELTPAPTGDYLRTSGTLDANFTWVIGGRELDLPDPDEKKTF